MFDLVEDHSLSKTIVPHRESLRGYRSLDTCEHRLEAAALQMLYQPLAPPYELRRFELPAKFGDRIDELF